jgi:hypothetical protein
MSLTGRFGLEKRMDIAVRTSAQSHREPGETPSARFSRRSLCLCGKDVCQYPWQLYRNIHALFQAFMARKAHGYCDESFAIQHLSQTKRPTKSPLARALVKP